MAEENSRFYFWTDERTRPAEVCAGEATASAERYGIGGRFRAWGKHRSSENMRRFNLELEPNEPNRFGWIVEVDPLDRAEGIAA